MVVVAIGLLTHCCINLPPPSHAPDERVNYEPPVRSVASLKVKEAPSGGCDSDSSARSLGNNRLASTLEFPATVVDVETEPKLINLVASTRLATARKWSL
jgi:hypothetical protein